MVKSLPDEMFILAQALMKRFTIILAIALTFLWSNVSGQQLRFDRFDLSNGLSQNNINGMEFDQQGNLWLGTLDGLNRYNGYQFDIFKPNHLSHHQLIGNHVICIGVGQNNNMWIITRGGGLNYFDATHQRFELVDADYFGQYNLALTQQIVQTDDSLLWLNNGSILGVWQVDTNQFCSFQEEGSIRGILKHTDEGVLAYGNFGIKHLRFDSNEKKLNAHKISLRPCYGLFMKQEQGWAIFDEGLFALNMGKVTDEPLVDFSGMPFMLRNKASINDFAINDDGYWIGGNGFLVRFYFENEKVQFQQFENDPLNDYSFKGYNVTRLIVDELDNLWIGTGKNGLLHLNHQKNQFQHYSWKVETSTDPESNPVRAICKTQQGDLWLGFDVEGLALLRQEQDFVHYKYYYNKSNNRQLIQNVRVIFEDSKGNIWLGVNDNLCIFNKRLNRFESVDCRFSWSWPNRCYVIKEFELGTVTITSPANIGFVNLEDGSLSTLQVKQPAVNVMQSVRDIVQDKYRNLWLAQDNSGILKITYPSLDYQFKNSLNIGLSDDKIYSLLADGDRLWIGTNGGLNLLNLETNLVEKAFFEEDGLSNNIIYSINKDREGILWMSTNRGITSFDPASEVFKTYLPNDYFMDDAHYVDANGTIFYGGYTGVVSFLPDRIRTDIASIRPGIESLSIFNQQVYPDDTLDGKIVLDRELSKTSQIELGYRQHTFSIGFNAYPFDFPNTHRFRYRLKNYQNDWNEDNGTRLATYTKVPPGNYTFELQVAPFTNQEQNTCELKVRIIPPFWMTTGFKVIVVIALILFVGGLFQLRIRQVKQRNIWLQKKVDEQTTELREQNRKIVEMSEQLHEADQSKLRFFTNVSHEFRTPLTLILGHLENLSGDSKLAVKSIRKNAIRLLKLINQLIDLRKMDQDQLKLAVSNFELLAFVQEMLDTFSSMANQKQISLRLDTTLKELWVWLDTDKTEKILYNLLSNAIKYSEPETLVVVRIQDNENDFQLDVVDQGIGIPEDELHTVFDRFYRAGASQHMGAGHGIGLSMVKGLIEIQHGTIQVQSQVGKGSVFSLSFPKGKAQYNESDFGEINKEGLALVEDDIRDDIGLEKLGERKILVVEDHAELAGFIQQSLSSSFDVKTAGNGKQALEMLAKYSPDLIISDVMMPVMDGLQFCKEVKTNIVTSHIPIILLSAKTDIDTQVSGLETGADDYMEKPFRPRLLQAKVHSLLSNREKLKNLFQKMPDNTSIGAKLNTRDREFLKSVNELIEKNLDNPLFSVEVLSGEVNMSRTTFYRKFTDLTGIKPSDYIRLYRLKVAHSLLSSSGKTIQEVGERVGFKSDSHFRKSFKDEFGLTPTKIQKQ